MNKERIKRENYITIQGFMVTDFDLKGNELIIYACIYSFSQAENQVYTGSLSYLAEWANCSKQGVINALKSLEDKGIIVKRENYINGVKFCEYYATNFTTGQIILPPVKLFDGGSQIILPNNIEDNIEIKETISKDIAKKRFIPPTYDDILEYATIRHREDLVEKFYDYYTEGNWKDKDGKQVKNWKQKFITWEQHNIFAKPNTNSQHSSNERTYTKEQYADMITDIDDWEQ